MLFNSFVFWIVFPIVFLLYWLIPLGYVTLRKLFLLLVSYLFYLNLKPVFACVLLFVTLSTYIGGVLFNRLQNKKLYELFFVLMTLSPLLLFKYYNFVDQSICQCLQLFGLYVPFHGLNWIVPIGISFYTFQALGYLFDVFREKINPERNLLDYSLFISFFPQIVSGPISKAEEMLPQIKSLPRFDYNMGKRGLKFLLWGMFLKVVVADRCGIMVNAVFENVERYDGATVLIATILFSIQIYCDFAGYSLIAIGIARTLGFNLVDNFRRPYFAVSVTDFWKRWHITLTRWLTQYIYIPLGGNRCSYIRCYINIFITFMVSGIWHGANWTFIIWGCMHGLSLIVERHLGINKHKADNHIILLVRIIFTFIVITVAWTIFRMPTVSSAFDVFIRIPVSFNFSTLPSLGMNPLIMLCCAVVIVVLKEVREEFHVFQFAILNNRLVKAAICVLLFSLILSIGVLDGGQFIYSEF